MSIDLLDLIAPPSDQLHGLLVEISDKCRCGESVAQTGPGVGPHRASLHCYDCGRHRGWLSYETAIFLISMIEKFGAPAEPIKLRRPHDDSIVPAAAPAPGAATINQPGAENESSTMNELQTTKGNALTTGGDPFEEYANAIAPTYIIGKLLRFSKGDYLAGEGDEEIPEGTTFTVAVDELMAGWIKWANSKPAEQVMIRIADSKVPAKRSDLGDNDQTTWEDDDRGEKRDPWQFTNYLPLMDNQGELYTFTTSSRGGLSAVAQVARRYAQHRRRHPDVFPMITLRVGSYQHSNREYGRIKFPDFEPAGYEPKSKFYAVAATAGFIAPEAEGNSGAPATPPPTAGAELDDIIPF